MKKMNFFGNPSFFKEKISKMTDWAFETFLQKKQEQWEFLQANRRSAYSVFNGDCNDSYALDAVCMQYLYEEKEKRDILITKRAI